MRLRLKFGPRLVGVVVFVGTSFAQQQPAPAVLTLQQSVQIAMEKNPLRKAALADIKAANADLREARSFLMPRLSFSEIATRGNDPVYVFGGKLRQQRFTANDFALNKLNTPRPLSWWISSNYGALKA